MPRNAYQMGYMMYKPHKVPVPITDNEFVEYSATRNIAEETKKWLRGWYAAEDKAKRRISRVGFVGANIEYR